MVKQNNSVQEDIRPISRQSQSKTVNEVSLDHDKKRMKILVVEDDQSQWPLWENIFSSLDKDLEIDWLTTAEEAQQYLRQAFQADRPYDLVISDVFLAGLGTGVDLWNRYGETTENFVFVSGVRLAKKEILKKMEFGEPVFLEKPLSVERCKRIIKLLCEDDSTDTQGGHYE